MASVVRTDFARASRADVLRTAPVHDARIASLLGTAPRPGLKLAVGAAAVVLTLGAVQLASGHDLSAPVLSAQAGSAVNRAAKSDRGTMAARVDAMRTIAFRVHDLPATSVLVRIPQTREAREAPRSPLPMRAEPGKPMVACEPVVSMLTEVARKLQPGRCVT